jgi:hypothetical protein
MGAFAPKTRTVLNNLVSPLVQTWYTMCPEHLIDVKWTPRSAKVTKSKALFSVMFRLAAAIHVWLRPVLNWTSSKQRMESDLTQWAKTIFLTGPTCFLLDVNQIRRSVNVLWAIAVLSRGQYAKCVTYKGKPTSCNSPSILLQSGVSYPLSRRIATASCHMKVYQEY